MDWCFKPLARIISSATYGCPKKSLSDIRFKPLARIISSATLQTNVFVGYHQACFKPLARIISSATQAVGAWCPGGTVCFKPLARIISSATPFWYRQSHRHYDVSNRLRELFPLQPPGHVHRPTEWQEFQTACANYFLCNGEVSP